MVSLHEIGGKLNLEDSISYHVKLTLKFEIMSVFEAPHVYYTLSELRIVKDVRMMTNTKIKTVGYIDLKGEPAMKEALDSPVTIPIDLTHIEEIISEIHPYIVYAVLCTVNDEPVVVAKIVKRFNSNSEDLRTYKNQCLLLRNRLKHYDNVNNLAKLHSWI